MRFNLNKRNAIALAVMALVLCVVYIIIRVSLMVVSLENTVKQVEALQKDAKAKDLSLLSTDFGNAVGAISMAESSANDPFVQLASYLPIIGSDIRAASIAATDGKLVLQGAEDVTHIANQLVKAGVGKNNLKDYSLLKSLRDSMGVLDSSIQKLNQDLVFVDPNSLHFGLDEKITKAKTTVSAMATASSKITPLLQIGSIVLEQPGQKRWFVSIQNLAEARATGGITGSYAILDVNNGKLKLQEYGTDKTLAKMGGINFSSYPEDLQSLWGVDLTDWRDINSSAHAPYAAKLLADGWQQHRGQKIDGVLFIGQGVVHQLSGAVGPVNVRGVEITPENVVDFLAKDIYAKFTDVQAKDAVVGELAKQLFSRVIDGKISASGFFAASASDKTGDRIMAWSQDKAIQQQFSGYQVAGEVSTQFGPNVLVTVNNGGGNKLEAYANLSIKYELGQCNVDTFTGYQGRRSRIVVDLTNNAPKSGLPAYVTARLDDYFGEARPKGSNREIVTIYGPVGSEAESVKLNGEDEFVVTGYDRDRPVWIFDIQILPGETKQLLAEIVEPISDSNQELIVGKPSITPPIMLNQPQLSVESIGECRLK